MAADRYALDQPIRSLVYIGELYEQEAAERFGLRTLRDLKRYTVNRTKGSNRDFLNDWLENPRRGVCVPPPKFRRKYSVRPSNEYAFNTVVDFMRATFPASKRQNIPAKLRKRPVRISHPRRCHEDREVAARQGDDE